MFFCKGKMKYWIIPFDSFFLFVISFGCEYFGVFFRFPKLTFLHPFQLSCPFYFPLTLMVGVG